MGDVPATGWANKKGTGDRTCACGTWKQHWLNNTDKPWPSECSVDGCSTEPTLGGHVYHPDVSGEKIVPLCESCNGLDGKFDLKGGVTVVDAAKSDNCGT
jgi:hypothetical protein